MGWRDWEGISDDFEEDFEAELRREEQEKREERRKQQEAEDAAENQRRRYPPNCGFCGEPLASVDHDHHPDWEQGFSAHEYGHYSCGTDIDDIAWAVGKEENGRRLTFEERVLTATTNQWGFRVPFYRCEDYGINPRTRGAQGQSGACRRLMELRWKTDPEELERDRTDTRTDRECLPVEHERKLVKKEREVARNEARKVALSRLTNTDTWEDATGKVWPLHLMTVGHRHAVLTWLVDHAYTFQKIAREVYYFELENPTATFVDAHTGEPVDLLDPDVEERISNQFFGESDKWMKGQPIYHAIERSLADEPPGPGRGRVVPVSVSATPPPVPDRRPTPGG